MPACTTVKIKPAKVTLVVLEAASVLAETEYVTVPLPVPFAPEVIVTHDATLAVVQLQVLEVVTVRLPVPPAAVNDVLAGEIA